jgi:hypothetical protein
MSDRLPPLNLVVQNGPNAGQVFTIDNSTKTIGRGEGCDIFVADTSLSRQHAQIRVMPTGYVLEDLGSTNGSFVNERPVPGGVLLASGDIIRLGETLSFRVEYGFDPNTPVTAAATVPTLPPAPTSQTGLGSRGFGLWLLGIGAGLLVILLLVAGLLYFRFAPQAELATPTVAAALPSPALADTSTPTVETPATIEPSPTVTALQVPGLAAAAANRQAFPVGALNKVDPFCEREVEVSATAPVFMTWEQPLAEADGETDYVAQWLNSVYYEISLDGRPITEINYQQTDSTLNWWGYLGILPAGTHHLSIRWYASRPVSTGLDVEPADGKMDVFGPGLAGESFCEIAVPEIIAAARPTSEPTPQPTPTPLPQAQAPPPPTPTSPPASSGDQIATGPSSSGGYTLALGSQRRYEQPWGAARDGDVCKTYQENNWDNSNPNFRGFNLELLLTNKADTLVPNGWTPTYTTQGGQSGRFCYHPYSDGRGTEVIPGATGSVTFFALVPADDYVNTVRLEVNGHVLQFCLDSNGEYCSEGQLASQPTPAPAVQTPTPAAPSAPYIEVYVTEDDGCIVYGWNIQNVKEIYFDGRGVPGIGQHRDCNDNSNDNNSNDNANDNDNDNDNDNGNSNDNNDDGDVSNPTLRIIHLDDRIEDIFLEPDSDSPYWRD